MKKIKEEKDLEEGKFYFCKERVYPFRLKILEVKSTFEGNLFLGEDRFWATKDNPQAFKRFDIVGPVEFPNFEEYEEI